MLASQKTAAQPVTIFAAASLTSALEEIASRTDPGSKSLRFSFGSSSTLAKQIEQGAPADIYLSANSRWMDYLAEKDLIEPDTRHDLLANTLVLVTPSDEPLSIRLTRDFDLSSAFEGRLAIGDPDHVPAGIYAKQALISLGWWDDLKDRLAPSGDVRAALTFIERAECPAGIVYATDAKASTRVVVTATFPRDSHDPIVYPIAVAKGRLTPRVGETLSLLVSPAAIRIFKNHGFTVLSAHRSN